MTNPTLTRRTTYRAAVQDIRPVAVFLHEWVGRAYPENVRVFDGYTANEQTLSRRSCVLLQGDHLHDPPDRRCLP